MTDIVGQETLDVMQKAVFYNKWLYSWIRPYLGEKILEAGAGTGNFSVLLDKAGNLTAVDYQKNYIKKLKDRKINAGFGDLEKGKFFFKSKKFDTIVNLNVLEHIKDDQKTLKNFYNLLEPGGRVVLLTPAHQFAYSDIDKNLGHYRRYTKEDLTKKFKKAGFEILEVKYLNILGLIGWFTAGKILNKKQLETSQISIFNYLSKPLLFIEKIISLPFGLSVFIVARKPVKKYKDKKVSIIVPAYNEERTIKEIITRVMRTKLANKLSKEVIVVNDGSIDKTTQILSKVKGIRIINKKNGGKGTAIISGLRKASGQIVIIQDADLEYHPKDYNKLLKPILTYKANAVYGTRLRKLKLKLFGKEKTLHPQNYVANRSLSWLTNLLFGTNLTDMETCYKVFRRELLNPNILTSKSFEIEPELTAVLAKRKEKITEVDIKVNPRDYSDGKKIKPKDGIIAIRKLLEEKFWL